MITKRLRGFLLGAVALGALLGCADRSPVDPAAIKPSHGLLGDLLDATSLLKCSALSADSVTQTIGPAGGVISVGPHSLTIPAGALDQDVEITAIAPSDTVSRIHLEPHGLTFDRAVVLRLSYANCEGLGSLLPKRVAYTTADLEILDLLPSLDNIFARRVSAPLTHFSDYAVAW
jgi:hypothetical protein